MSMKICGALAVGGVSVLTSSQDRRAVLFPLFAPFGLRAVSGLVLGACLLLSSLQFSVLTQHRAQLCKDKCT